MRVTVSPDQIGRAFERVKGSATFAESAALFAKGHLPLEMLQAMTLCPEILRVFGETGKGIYPGGAVERSVKEFIILEASRRNRCQFCRDSHIDFVRALGYSPDPMRELADSSRRSERERLAIEYTAAAMTDANAIPDGLFARLKNAFADEEIVEITFVIGFINLLNLFNNCLQVRYHGECRVGGS